MSPYTRRPTRNGIAALFITALVFVLFLTWKGERDSCQRQTGSRNGIQTIAAAAWNARLNDAELAMRDGDDVAARNFRARAAQYLKAWQESAPLDCSGLFPDTTVKRRPGTPLRLPLG